MTTGRFNLAPTVRTERVHLRSMTVLALAFAALAAGGCTDLWSEPAQESPEPERPQCEGTSSFISADTHQGPLTPEGVSASSGTLRMLNPNSDAIMYELLDDRELLVRSLEGRGVQLIELSGADAPEMVGEVNLGLPFDTNIVGLHVLGDRVYVTLDNWFTYEDDPSSWLPKRFNSGAILTIDISDVTDPVVVARTLIDEEIEASVIAETPGLPRLVVVGDDRETSFVKSFNLLASGDVSLADELRIDSLVDDFHLTSQRVVLADFHPGEDNDDSFRTPGRTEISLVDITAEDGRLERGNVIELAGETAAGSYSTTVEKIRIVGDTLRIVYEEPERPSVYQSVETIDVSDIHQIALVDRARVNLATFSDDDFTWTGSNLLIKNGFGGRTPSTEIHQLDIDAAGEITQRPPVETDYDIEAFYPFSADQRLLGYGAVDGELVIGLHDAGTLTADASPLVQQGFEVPEGWTDYDWNDRTAMVVEDAVQARAPGGEEERHLLFVQLLKEVDGHPEHSAMQVFSFSDTTVTRRGVIEHRSAAVASFLVAPNVVANLSPAEITLFDVSNPDDPRELGRELGEPFHDYFAHYSHHAMTRLLEFGDYAVWKRRATAGSPESVGENDELGMTLAVHHLSDDPSTTPALAEIPVRQYGELVQVGDLLVELFRPHEGYHRCGPDAPRAKTHIKVWDLSNPASPVLASDFVTEAIDRAKAFTRDDGERCTRDPAPVWGVGDSLVFGSVHIHGTRSYPLSDEERRASRQFEFQVLDLRDPAAPTVSTRVAMPSSEHDVSMLTSGDSLYVMHKEPVEIDGEARPYVRYFFKEVDLSDPDAPEIGPSVNIPGRLIGIDGDTLITEDEQWGERLIQTELHKLQRGVGRACSRGVMRYPERDVQKVKFDEAGKIFVTHKKSYQAAELDGESSQAHTRPTFLSVLDLGSPGLLELASYEMEAYAVGRTQVHAGRLFLQDEGTVVVNMQDPGAPFVEANLPGHAGARIRNIDGELSVPGATGWYELARYWTHIGRSE